MRQLMTATAFSTLLFALPAFGDSAKDASSAFALPEGCHAFLTVQNKRCSVVLMWHCDENPKGQVWTGNFSDFGLESISAYSAAYQWLDTIYTWDESREQFSPPAADPIDMDTLIDTGSDDYDFTMHRSMPDRSYDIHVTGSDRLIGENQIIDGIELEKVATRLKIVAEDGTVEYEAKGIQYFSRQLGQFFLGTEDAVGSDGVSVQYDDSPLDFILPGEPGFGVTTPLYECGGGSA